MIHVFVKLTAKAGCATQLQEGVRTLVKATQHEPGHGIYRAYVSEQDPAVVHFFEAWPDRAAQQAHVQTSHYQAFFELSKGLLGRRPDIDVVTPL